MKDYFQFTRIQKIGVVTLSALILALIVILNVNNHRGLPDIEENSAHFNMVLLDSNPTDSLYQVEQTKPNLYQENNSDNFFEFDPNTLGKSGWESLGFSAKQAVSIIKYRESYGPFEKPEDVGRIYVISDEKYAELKPFMIFDQPAGIELKATGIEINSATQVELESIYGIGPYFAKKTIKYRDALGGFVSKEQYGEIEGLSEDGIAALENNTTIGFQHLVKLKINSASKDELRSHPYLDDWAAVTEILSQRDKKKIENFEWLANKGVLSEETIKKLSPYIDFE